MSYTATRELKSCVAWFLYRNVRRVDTERTSRRMCDSSVGLDSLAVEMQKPTAAIIQER